MKRLLSLLLVCTFLIALVACGEQADGAPAGTKLASNPDVTKYYLYVPTEWSVLSSTGTTMAQNSGAGSVVATHHTSLYINKSKDVRHTLWNYFYGNDFLTEFFPEAKSFEDVSLDELSYRKEYLDYALTYSHTLTDGTDRSEDKGYFSRLVKLYDKKLDAASGEEVTTFAFVTTPMFETVGNSDIKALKLIYTASLDGNLVQQMTYLCYHDDCFYNITFSCTPVLFEEDAPVFEGIIQNMKFVD